MKGSILKIQQMLHGTCFVVIPASLIRAKGLTKGQHVAWNLNSKGRLELIEIEEKQLSAIP